MPETVDSLLNDPVHSPLWDPVIILHPLIAPYVYDRKSVLKAEKHGWFRLFNLDMQNALKPVHLVQGLIESYQKEQKEDSKLSITLDKDGQFQGLDEIYASVYRRDFPGKSAALVTTDGHTYDLEDCLDMLSRIPWKDSHGSPFNPEEHIIVDGFHKHFMEVLDEVKAKHSDTELADKTIPNLKDIFRNFSQPVPQKADIQIQRSNSTNFGPKNVRISNLFFSWHMACCLGEYPTLSSYSFLTLNFFLFVSMIIVYRSLSVIDQNPFIQMIVRRNSSQILPMLFMFDSAIMTSLHSKFYSVDTFGFSLLNNGRFDRSPFPVIRLFVWVSVFVSILNVFMEMGSRLPSPAVIFYERRTPLQKMIIGMGLLVMSAYLYYGFQIISSEVDKKFLINQLSFIFQERSLNSTSPLLSALVFTFPVAILSYPGALHFGINFIPSIIYLILMIYTMISIKVLAYQCRISNEMGDLPDEDKAYIPIFHASVLLIQNIALLGAAVYYCQSKIKKWSHLSSSQFLNAKDVGLFLVKLIFALQALVAAPEEASYGERITEAFFRLAFTFLPEMVTDQYQNSLLTRVPFENRFRLMPYMLKEEAPEQPSEVIRILDQA